MAQGGISASEKATSVSSGGGGWGGVSFQQPTVARPNDYKYKSLHVANKHRDGERFGRGRGDSVPHSVFGVKQSITGWF